MFNITVDASIRFAETSLAGQSILQYAPNSPGSRAYRALAEVVLGMGSSAATGRSAGPRERVRAAKG